MCVDMESLFELNNRRSCYLRNEIDFPSKCQIQLKILSILLQGNIIFPLMFQLNIDNNLWQLIHTLIGKISATE